MLVPVQLDIPAEYVDGFLDGSLMITKAVVRAAKDGKIQKHIDLLPTVKNEAVQLLSNKKVRLVVGITTAVIVVGGLITGIVKKANEKSDVEIPECVIRFQNLFRAYLKEAQKGDLSVETINSLLETLDEVEATQNRTVTIDFSTEELTTLLMQIYEYTNKLAAATSVSAESLSAPTHNSEDNLLSLKQYLHLQKQIIESAA